MFASRACSRVAPSQTGPLTPLRLNVAARLQSSHRWSSTSSSGKVIVRSRRVGLSTLALTGVLSSSAYFYLRQPEPAQSRVSVIDVDETQRTHVSHAQEITLTELIRTYLVYSMCSVPWLVDYSPSILSALLSVPGVNRVVEVIVRKTFFSQFVGGESAPDTFPVLARLRQQNKGAILNYSAEVNENENESIQSKDAAHKHHIEEIIRCIDAAAEFEDLRQVDFGSKTGRKTWVAVKLTALTPDANTFMRFSKYLLKTRPPAFRNVAFPGIPRPSDLDILKDDPVDLPITCPLTNGDVLKLRELKDDLFQVCTRAREKGVTIVIDAEHSWYQPAIEAFQFALMREFNYLSRSNPSIDEQQRTALPLVYGTFQAYLRRTPEHLEQSLRDAEEGNFALGVKLVRGAYHELETASHKLRRHQSDVDGSSSSSSLSVSSDDPPVWQTKAETDACFNACTRMLIGRVAQDIRKQRKSESGTASAPRLSLLFGTHNSASCELVLNTLVDEGLAERAREEGRDGWSTDVIYVWEEVVRRIAVGQLYGMCEDLSTSLAQRVRNCSTSSSIPAEPFVLKYIPYGPLPLVMPYLGRRAIENRSVLQGGGAREEREMARKEIWKRMKGWFGLA